MNNPLPTLAIIGGGPAGLMAAETAARAGVRVQVFDAMPSVGRKFLLAGKGGLNLTHAEPFDRFLGRYGARSPLLESCLRAFDADTLRHWAAELGVETFVGTSQRVFPVEMKAAPLLRAWLKRLRELGVIFHARHRWQGWTDSGALHFETPVGTLEIQPDAMILALGGGSWARLGSDGRWVPWLRGRGIGVRALRPANCGFDVHWSDHFSERFAGIPVKTVSARIMTGPDQASPSRTGEFMITRQGVEGGLIYALSADLRESLETWGTVELHLDLSPDRSETGLADALAQPRGSRSLANHLKRAAGLHGVKSALLRELAASETFTDPLRLAAAIKSLPLHLSAPRPLDEAISSAGGVAFEALDDRLMLRDLPGVFCAGEMLDWEAPTGGYLLTACFATGRAAGEAAALWLQSRPAMP